MISVLCPSRGRPEALERSIESLGPKAEVLVMVDPDERELYNRFFPYVSRARFGYSRLHEYYNHLYPKANGDWLVLWNDDAIMQTPNWVDIVDSYEPNQVLNPGGNLPGFCTFPIVPKRWAVKIGHFSLNAHNDTWWEFIAKQLGRLTQVPEIYVRHERFDLTGQNNDSTYRERVYTSDEFWSTEMQQAITEDAQKIATLL